MRAYILWACILFFSTAACAQQYPLCNNTYFAKSRKVATSQCYDNNRHWGKAKAFDRNGHEIYTRDLRRVGGHSSVQFSYYESGAVKSANWSSAPDGGIQWYKSYTDFSEDGKITNEREDSYDRKGVVMVPSDPLRKHPPVKPAPPAKQEVMECAVIYSSEFWFTNYTPYTVVVTATRKFSKSENNTLSLRRRETLKAGQMILAQQFDDPAKYYDFSVSAVKGSKQRFIVVPAERQPENSSKEVRRYYYEVRRII